ncbi:MAG: FtsX-like permease family protein [Desulfuromonadales bacterium]
MSDPLISPALRLVQRELRGGLRGFGVFLVCIFLGVFAISAIGSFTGSVRKALLDDASALLGGDLEVRLVHRPLTQEQSNFLKERGELSEVISMRAMAGASGKEQRALVELKAVDGTYPLYGEIELTPSRSLTGALSQADETFGAVVEEILLQRLELEVGDHLRIGEGVFSVSGVIDSEPDRTVRAFTLGPRVMISRQGLASTALLQPGALVTYTYRLRLPDRTAADQVKSELEQAFPDAGWRIRTWEQAAPRVRSFLDRLEINLTLIGLCALLIGGLGVSGAVRGYLDSKIVHIATMKCLGASGRLLFTAYLLQVLILGAIGSFAGLTVGAALPFLAAHLFGDFLPFPLQPSLFPGVLTVSALFGFLVALLFSLKPLAVALRVPPAVLFRGYTRSADADPGTGVRIAIVVVAIALSTLAVLTSADRRLALWFILGAAGCFVFFRFAAVGLIECVRRLPRSANPRLRLGLANIHRRGSPAAGTLFSMGLGLTALVIIALVQANLNDLVETTVPEKAPAFFFLDIQPKQVDPFEETLRSLPQVTRYERSPTLRGRITAIDDVPVENADISPDVRWAVRGDRYLSYAAERPAETEIVAGQWWPTDYDGPPLISLTSDLAKGFGIGIGDTLTVNLLGRSMTGEIANLREADWSSLNLDFAVLFSPGVLESAPRTHIATVHTVPGGSERVFQEITGRFPNVSAIDIREVLANVSRTIDRIGGAFKGIAAVALLSGLIVLAGAVSADQHRRIRDAVIFKVCGATRRDILTTFAVEFLILGIAAGFFGVIIGSVAAFGILEGLLDTDFSLHPATVLLTLVSGIGLTLVLGMMGTWKALGQKPAIFLRNE